MVAKCDECSFIGRHNSELKKHRWTVHSDVRPWKCPFDGCNFRCKLKCHLKTHQRIHETQLTLRRPFPCKFKDCGFRATHENALKNHWRSKHTAGRTKDFQCPLCPSKYYTNAVLQDHLQSHLKERLHECTGCSYRTHNRDAFATHVRKIHAESATFFSCPFEGCHFRTKYSGHLKPHYVIIHEPDPLVRRPFPCSFRGCIYRATTAANLKDHIDRRHNRNSFSERKYSCPMCSKLFYEPKHVKSHINNVHTNEKNYKCEKCNHKTNSAGNLRVHTQRAHGRREERELFKCKFCDYRAYNKHNVNLHAMNVHSKERRFKCEKPGCNYKTNVFHLFQTHGLIHEEDPTKKFPFECKFPDCDFRRKLRPQIKLHEQKHTISNERFRCKLCPNSCFPDKYSLFFHECMKHNKKSHKCPICDYSCAQKCYFDKHIRTHHNLDPETYHQSAASAQTSTNAAKSSLVEHSLKRDNSKHDSPCSTHKLPVPGLTDALAMTHSFFRKIPIVMLQRIHIEI